MRSDTLALIQQSIKQVNQAYVLANHGSEGNVLLTIQAVTDARQTGEP